MLEPQDEYMLAKRWREHGDRDAAHKLVTSHLRLVDKIAMGYRGSDCSAKPAALAGSRRTRSFRRSYYFLTSEHLLSLSGWATSSAGMPRLENCSRDLGGDYSVKSPNGHSSVYGRRKCSSRPIGLFLD
jgi:hypothetical protein